MRLGVILATLLLLVSPATSQTLPSGFGTVAGNSYHWAGWSANEHYVPARCTYSYDASSFPWAPPFTISRLSLRAHGMAWVEFAAHEKRMRIKMSTNGSSTNRPCYTFEDALGRDRSYVLGDAKTWRTVKFPKRDRLSTVPAAWGPVINLDRPFTVPAGTRNLQIEFLVESNSTQAGTWYVDASYSSRALDRGWTTRLEGKCPSTLRAPVAAGVWPGADVIFSVHTDFMAVPVVGLLGTERATPKVLGPCTFHPQVFAVLADVSGIDKWVTFHFGRLPDLNHFARRRLVFQAIFVGRGLPLNGLFGFTDAVQVDIGEGWSAPVLRCSTVYSYGKDLCPSNPDQRFTAAYVSPRAPIIKLN